jgi:hypothetical protein
LAQLDYKIVRSLQNPGAAAGRAFDFSRDDLPVDFIIETPRPCRSNSLSRNDERRIINFRMILPSNLIASRADCQANLGIQLGVAE